VSEQKDDEIHRIVQQVLNRYLAGSQPPSPPAVPSPPPVTPAEAKATEAPTPARKVVAIGADHGGFELKETLKPEVAALGYEVVDVGTHNKDAVDYPDLAHEVARLVSEGKAWRGIMIDGAGIGSCIVANKLPGVRAGMAYDYSSALNSREHNDTNLLTLGAGLIGANLARQIVHVWLSTPFGGGRHERRVEKIAAVEKQYLK
jgi:ribose 5-phosphate isomerase B